MTQNETVVLIIGSVISFLTSGLAAYLAYKGTVKRVDADKELIVADAAEKMMGATGVQIANLTKELGRLEHKVDQLSEELRLYKNGTRLLIKQIRNLGVEPDWVPPH